jgi:hypothetical protein
MIGKDIILNKLKEMPVEDIYDLINFGRICPSKFGFDDERRKKTKMKRGLRKLINPDDDKCIDMEEMNLEQFEEKRKKLIEEYDERLKKLKEKYYRGELS